MQENKLDCDAMPDHCRAGVIRATANDDNVKSFFDLGRNYYRVDKARQPVTYCSHSPLSGT